MALSTGFDVSTASYDSNFSVSSQETSPQGLAFNNDGTKMFIIGDGGKDVNEYTLSTGFDVSTASFVDSFDISSEDGLPNGLAFNSDGTKMFVTGNRGNDINEYTLSTGFDVSTASHGNISVSSQDTTPSGIKFNHDGTKLFMVGVVGADINEYTLTSPFSLVNVSMVMLSTQVILLLKTLMRTRNVKTAVRLGSLKVPVLPVIGHFNRFMVI